MIVLTLTASTDQGGLALFKDGKLLAEKLLKREAGSQSEQLTSELQKLLKNKKFAVQDIGRILLDIGPGSFTGCRIAASFAKTLAYSLNLEIHTTTSLEILRAQNPPGSFLCIDAHKSLYYCLDADAKAPSLLTSDKVASQLKQGAYVAGVYSTSLATALKAKKSKKPKDKKLNFPLPRTLGKMFFENPSQFKTLTWKTVEPLYIRSPAAVENLGT